MIERVIRFTKRFIANKDYRFAFLAGYGFFDKVPDKIYLQRMYNGILERRLDLENPKSFSEKMQWLKLYNRKPEYIIMVDKYDVKQYVSKIIGEKYIIPTIGVWDKVEDINFESLPNQFVIKATHDSGGIVIVKDKNKLNERSARKKIRKSLRRNYYYSYREWPYKDVGPRIIAEEYISNGVDDLCDYKFYCFNGIPRYCQVIRDRNVKQTVDFFDMKWEHQRFTGMQKPFKPHSEKKIEKPYNFEKMIEFAIKLSQEIPFVRVDFYEVNQKLYFGELTFFPAGGFGEFQPDEWNYKLGNMIDLSCVEN